MLEQLIQQGKDDALACERYPKGFFLKNGRRKIALGL